MITDAGDVDGPLTNSLLMYRSELSGTTTVKSMHIVFVSAVLMWSYTVVLF